MMIQKHLRYNISDWEQLSQCLSNNSSKYRIHVTKYINDARISGRSVSVTHDDFGVVYFKFIDVRGEIIEDTYQPKSYPEILNDLKLFGFDVTYKPQNHLSGDQLQYLMSIRDMGFDKIRVMNVIGKTVDTKIVVFKSEELPKWLVNTYQSKKSEFTEAIYNSAAAAVDKKDFNWDWLFSFVANIDDILEDNA